MCVDDNNQLQKESLFSGFKDKKKSFILLKFKVVLLSFAGEAETSVFDSDFYKSMSPAKSPELPHPMVSICLISTIFA